MQQCNAMKSLIIQIFLNEEKKKESQVNISLTNCSKKKSFPSNYRSLCLIFSNEQVAEGGASALPLATAMPDGLSTPIITMVQ